MKIAVIGFAIILGAGGLFSLNNSPTDLSTKPQQNIQEIQTDTKNGGQLIDVRTPAEYAEGHIDGSINLSLQDIMAGEMPSAAKDKPVYIYCRSGNRSAEASTILGQAGYTDVIDLGGMSDVESLGVTVKT